MIYIKTGNSRLLKKKVIVRTAILLFTVLSGFSQGLSGNGVYYKNSCLYIINGTDTNSFNGRTGIGIASPEAKLEVYGNDSTAVIQSTVYQNNPKSAGFIGKRARGTTGAPIALTTDDNIVSFGGRAYTSNGFVSSVKGAFTVTCAEPQTGNHQGTYLRFFTTNNSSTTITEKMRLSDSGKLGIGTINPLALLSVGSSSQMQVDSAGNISTTGKIYITSDLVNSKGIVIKDDAVNANYWRLSIDSLGIPTTTNLGHVAP